MTAQITDTFLFKGRQYELIGMTDGDFFFPEQFGIEPEALHTACWRGFYASYKLLLKGLYLVELTIRDRNENYPPIDGIEPEKDYGQAIYRGLKLLVPFNPQDNSSGMSLMRIPYGYIRGTMGVDGDHVDVFVGPDREAKFVYVIHTVKAPDFAEYDEDKCVLGVASPEEAFKVFHASYSEPRFFGGMSIWPFDEFKEAVRLRRAGREPDVRPFTGSST